MSLRLQSGIIIWKSESDKDSSPMAQNDGDGAMVLRIKKDSSPMAQNDIRTVILSGAKNLYHFI